MFSIRSVMQVLQSHKTGTLVHMYVGVAGATNTQEHWYDNTRVLWTQNLAAFSNKLVILVKLVILNKFIEPW